MLFDVKLVDRRFYQSRLRDWLPGRIIDVHTHIWRGTRGPAGPTAAAPAGSARSPLADARTVSWPARVAQANPIEELLETYRLMLPEQRRSRPST